MKNSFCSLLAALCLLAAPGAQAQGAENFRVANGTWVVESELNGKPGRGLGLEVTSQNLLILQVYNYRADGSPTFHLASGAMDGNRFTGPLVAFRGGRYFGSPPLVGVVDNVAGNVSVAFTSADTGVIQFPGEEPVKIARFYFDGRNPEQLISENIPDEGVTYMGFKAAEPGAHSVRFGAVLGRKTATNGSLIPDRFRSASLQFSTVNAATGELESQSFSNVQCAATLTRNLFRCSLDASGSNGAWLHVLGDRLELRWKGDTYVAVVNTTSFGSFAQPTTGTWIVEDEVNGKPGRGMLIDVQNDAVVAQIYNYEVQGDATFHLMSNSRRLSKQVTGELVAYQGGRYFGSAAREGWQRNVPGMVDIAFDSWNSGTIRFPGEPAKKIVAFDALLNKGALESLLGHWLFTTTRGGSQPALTVDKHLSTVRNGFASTAGGEFQCHFPGYDPDTPNQVMCLEGGTPNAAGGMRFERYYLFDMRHNAVVTGRWGRMNADGTPNEFVAGLVQAVQYRDAHGRGWSSGKAVFPD